jgi:hypothetical protein
LAPGTYDIIYFNINCQQIDSVGKKVIYSYQHSENAQNAQISLFSDEQAARSAPSAKKPEKDGRKKDEEDEDDQEDEGDQEGDEDEDEDDQEDEDEDDQGGDEGDEDQEPDAESAPAGDERPFSYRSALQRDRLAAREEARHIRMLKVQQKTDKQNQRQIRRSMYAREVGETHQLNAMMRREVVEANRIAALSNKRGFDELGRYREVNAALREDFKRNQDAIQQTVEKTVGLLDFVLEKAAEKLAAPPPPSTDFTGLGQSAIEMTGKVLLALLTKGAPPPALPPASQPAIPAPASPSLPAAPAVASAAQQAPNASAAPAGQSPSAPAAGQSAASASPAASPASSSLSKMHPALAKLAAKFSNLGEMELARRISTPDGWKVLFDEISAEMEAKPQAVTEVLEEKT